MGTGKTTLIKGFTDNYMPREDIDSLLPHTIEVAPYDYSLYDTPGLSDNEGGTNDHEYLKDMVRNQISPDLIVFTIKMDSADSNRLSVEDEYVMKNVADTFGWARWRYAMVMLTFANKVYRKRECEEISTTDFTLLRF